MNRLIPCAVLTATLLFGQFPGRKRDDDRSPVRLPDGRLQSEEILKADHATNLKDAGELIRLSEELKIELEKNDRHVLSVSAVKKTEEIEKLAKKIRGRMKRY
jgi:ATP-dependent helicase/DNAse subunit B